MLQTGGWRDRAYVYRGGRGRECARRFIALFCLLLFLPLENIYGRYFIQIPYNLIEIKLANELKYFVKVAKKPFLFGLNKFFGIKMQILKENGKTMQ